MDARGGEGRAIRPSRREIELTTPPPKVREISPRFAAAPQVPIPAPRIGAQECRYRAARPAPESARHATRRRATAPSGPCPGLAGHLNFSCKKAKMCGLLSLRCIF